MALDLNPVFFTFNDYFIRLMESLNPQLQTEAGPALLGRLEDDHDNLRAAFDWALTNGNLKSGLRLANAMYRLWFWHDDAVEAQHRLGPVFFERCDYEGAPRKFEEALAIDRVIGKNRDVSGSTCQSG